jgi:hypothetical protein
MKFKLLNDHNIKTYAIILQENESPSYLSRKMDTAFGIPLVQIN